MSRFSEFFSRHPGNDELPQPPRAEQREPPVEIRPRRLSSELEFNAFQHPEANEVEPRTLRFAQAKYGKLVQHEGGPIVSGYEHNVTGASEDFPSGLFRKAVPPTKLPFGMEDSGSHLDYPWKDEGGGIVRVTIMNEGRPYVLCARCNFRSEAGEGAIGREFTAAHIIAIPAEEWSVAAIPQLARALKADSLTESRTDMEAVEIKTDILDQELPDEWLDADVKEMLKRALAGQPLSIQDWKTSVGDSLDQIYRCLLCLPEYIGRQISFGAGLVRMEGGVRLARGKIATTPVRKIGETWKGDDTVDLSFGQKYLDALLPRLEKCRTPRDVIRAVETLPPDLFAGVETRMLSE